MSENQVSGYLILGDLSTFDSEVFDNAQMALDAELPPSYVSVVEQFGQGAFNARHWVTPPPGLQSYGALMGKGEIESAALAGMIVCAGADDGTCWAWKPADLKAGGEPPVYRILPGSTDLEDPAAPVEVEAADLHELITGWQLVDASAGIVTPHFLPAVPMKSLANLRLIEPSETPGEGHHALIEALRAEAVVVTLRESGDDADLLTQFYLDEWGMLVTIRGLRSAPGAEVSGQLSLRWMGSATGEGVELLARVMALNGWYLGRSAPAGFTWPDHLDEEAREALLETLGELGWPVSTAL